MYTAPEYTHAHTLLYYLRIPGGPNVNTKQRVEKKENVIQIQKNNVFGRNNIHFHVYNIIHMSRVFSIS